MSLQPNFIAGSSIGLETDKKPFLLPDQAFPTLYNAYVWRDRVKKREGLELLGRLRRQFLNLSLGNSQASIWDINTIWTTLVPPIVPQANAEIEAGSVEIVIGAITFTDQGDGTLTSATPGNSGTINYITGQVFLTHTAGVGVATTISFNYFPSLPVMGIDIREIANINAEQTIWFDTTYAYVFAGTGFTEFIPGTVWAGTDADFFWSTNYRGITADVRLFFTTNFVCTAANPIRYTDGVTWTNFNPLVSATDNLYQARIIIPYYGRLLALNVFEGTTAGGYGGAVNIVNRCRFSAIGNPVAVDAWRSDLFGKGGFLDAPTNEQIVSASFFANTLIVDFEFSKWQLRYVGEYGLPFIWERISSDFGASSTFSSTLFDNGIVGLGNRAITNTTATFAQRIDVQIPDAVFNIRNAESGPQRVQGIRDFRREIVYWCYPDAQEQRKFPNRTLVFNYRNNTYAIFRNNVTAFGTHEPTTNVLWDSLDVFWDDMDVFWDDVDDQEGFERIVCGNQEGFVHYFGYVTEDEPSLAITAIDLTVSPYRVTVPNHNLEDGEIIMLSGLLFDDPQPTDLNNELFSVQLIYDPMTGVLDENNFNIFTWDFTSEQYVMLGPQTAGDYLGKGKVTLFPQLYVITKDFNPYQANGLQLKLSYVDFLTDATPNAVMSVSIGVNTSNAVIGNLIVGNTLVETFIKPTGDISGITNSDPCVITSIGHGLRTGNRITISNVQGTVELNGNSYLITVLTNDTFFLNDVDSTTFGVYVAGTGTWTEDTFYVPDSDIAWHRFFATVAGQYINIQMYYDDNLMNTLSTHQQDWILNAINVWTRPGGKIVF